MEKVENLLEIPEELEALVKAGLYGSKEEVIREAVDMFFAIKPNMRLEAAIELYKEGKVTLGRAAEFSGITRWRFKDILLDRGIQITIVVDASNELDERIRRSK